MKIKTEKYIQTISDIETGNIQKSNEKYFCLFSTCSDMLKETLSRILFLLDVSQKYFVSN